MHKISNAKKVTLSLLFAAIAFAGVGYADLITLRSGGVIEGRVTGETLNDVEIAITVSNHTGSSVMGLSKKDILKIEREITGQKVVQVFNVAPKVQPIPRTTSPQQIPLANTLPAITTAKLTPPDLLREAELYASQKDYEGTIKQTRSIFSMTDVEMADLKQAQVIQSKAYDDWIRSLEQAERRFQTEVTSLTQRQTDLQDEMRKTQNRIAGEKHGDHYYYDYPYRYYGYRGYRGYRSMGGESSIAMAQNNLRTLQPKLEEAQRNLATVQASIKTVSADKTRARYEAEDSIRVALRSQPRPAFESPKPVSAVVNNPEPRVIVVQAHAPAAAPIPTPHPPTPQTKTPTPPEESWWSTHWYFIVIGVLGTLLLFRR